VFEPEQPSTRVELDSGCDECKRLDQAWAAALGDYNIVVSLQDTQHIQCNGMSPDELMNCTMLLNEVMRCRKQFQSHYANTHKLAG
jgi:hypothetical protein